MPPLTVIAAYQPGPGFENTIKEIAGSGLVERTVIVTPVPIDVAPSGPSTIVVGSISSGETLAGVLDSVRTEYVFFITGERRVATEPGTLARMISAAAASGAGMVYSDFHDQKGLESVLHPLNDYQLGSLRDDFDFGPLMLFSVFACRRALKKYGPVPTVKFAALYDLRLKVSIEYPVYHLKEPLYSVSDMDTLSGGPEGIFAYVDPRNRAVQEEMEGVCTPHLRNINAYVPAERLKRLEDHGRHSFPVEASVIIPVKNRKGTVGQAVESALAQETDFPFNVIVVDNYSTDGTTEILSGLASRHPALTHIIPVRTDLGIGGCWNEALLSEPCGRYAVQLDSDDLYAGPDTLQRMVDMLRQGGYAMVIGSYRITDFDLREIPPGLIDHREWTDHNGHNNALRINGLGAPRAFNASLMRAFGFLNVSYGEDYAAALRICREYRIGRIYDSLYLCRRWSGNTDASLSLEAMNRNDAFKDRIRTDEILARKRLYGKG